MTGRRDGVDLVGGSRAGGGAEPWFDDLYARTFPAISGYVLRRVADEFAALDVVACVFAVAWERRAVVPAAPDDRLWLFGVARRKVLEHQRAAARRGRLLDRLRHEAGDASDPDARRGLPGDVEWALGRLRPADREVVRLIAWEELTRAEAAVVLGCSPGAVGIRWHRAIKRLRRHLGDDPAPDRSFGPVDREEDPDVR